MIAALLAGVATLLAPIGTARARGSLARCRSAPWSAARSRPPGSGASSTSSAASSPRRHVCRRRALRHPARAAGSACASCRWPSTIRPPSPTAATCTSTAATPPTWGSTEPTGALQRYDPSRNRWSRLRSSPTAARGARRRGDRPPPLRGGRRERRRARCGRSRSTTSSRGAGHRGPSFPPPARNHTTGVASGGRFYVLAGRDTAELRRRRALRPAPAQLASACRRCTHRAGRHRLGAPERRAHRRLRRRAAGARAAPRSPRSSCSTRAAAAGARCPTCARPRHGLGGAALGRRVFAIEGGPTPGFAFTRTIEFLDVPAR